MHARKVRQIYAERRLGFAERLGETFADRIRFDLPNGHLAFLATLSRPRHGCR